MTILGPILALVALADWPRWRSAASRGPVLGAVGAGSRLPRSCSGRRRPGGSARRSRSSSCGTSRRRPAGRRLVGRALDPDTDVPSLRAALAPARSGGLAGGRARPRVDPPSGRRQANRGPGRAKAVAVGLAIVAGWIVPGMIPPRPRPLPGGLARAEGLAPPRRCADRREHPQGGPGHPVLGRPAMLFYTTPLLGAEGHPQRPAARLEGLLVPVAGGWAIVDAVLLRQEGDPDAVLDRLLDRWEIVAEEPTTLSKATLLDVDPRAAVGDLSARDEPLILLQPRIDAALSVVRFHLELYTAPRLATIPPRTDSRGVARRHPHVAKIISRGQPEGGGRQDDHRDQPRRRAGQGRAGRRWSSTSIPSATPRAGSGVEPAQRHPLVAGQAAGRVGRRDVAAEPVRPARLAEPGRRRRALGLEPAAGVEPPPAAQRRAARSSTSSSSTAPPRSASSPARRWGRRPRSTSRSSANTSRWRGSRRSSSWPGRPRRRTTTGSRSAGSC